MNSTHGGLLNASVFCNARNLNGLSGVDRVPIEQQLKSWLGDGQLRN